MPVWFYYRFQVRGASFSQVEVRLFTWANSDCTGSGGSTGLESFVPGIGWATYVANTDWEPLTTYTQLYHNSGAAPAENVTYEVQVAPSNTGPWQSSFIDTVAVPAGTAMVQTPCQPFTPPPPCQYGTQPAPTAPAVAIVTSVLVDAICTALGAAWLSALFDPLIGWVIDTGVLCATGPPTMPYLTPQSLLDDIGEKFNFLQAGAWYVLCACTPGSPPPVAYTPPPIVEPPGWPPPPTYTCSDSDVCTTLEYILRRLDQLSNAINVNVNVTQYPPPAPKAFAFTTGTVHSGLTGAVSLSVANLVGLRIELTANVPPHQLVGNPPYVWDAGWVSASDGGAMIEEWRITRTDFEWFPTHMPLATTVGVYLLGSTVARITELVPA